MPILENLKERAERGTGPGQASGKLPISRGRESLSASASRMTVLFRTIRNGRLSSIEGPSISTSAMIRQR
jgi:hypothetical protein